jgi:hypothetical protein
VAYSQSLIPAGVSGGVWQSPSPTCHAPSRPVCNLRFLLRVEARCKRVNNTRSDSPPKHTVATTCYSLAATRYLPHHQLTNYYHRPPSLGFPPSLTYFPATSVVLLSLAHCLPLVHSLPALGALLGRVCQPFASASTLLRATSLSD